MSNATKFPLSSDLFIGQWSKKDATSPKLASPINSTETIITVTQPLKDKDGSVVSGSFLAGIKKSNGWTEIIWIPSGSVSGDGKTLGTTLKPVVRGIKPDGYDYTAGSSDFANSHDADELVFCVIPAVIPELIRSALQGLIATGSADFIMGTEGGAETTTIYRSTTAGTRKGMFRWDNSTGKAQYSNDGSSWVNVDDSVASVLFKVSSADTTAGYAEDKIQAGSNITITKKNSGANEYLEISTSLPDSVSAHEIYAPAYLTGGTGAETNTAIWDSVSDGEFAITINGVAYDITGLDLTGITDMDDVAAVIQAGIRAATSSTETCVWSTDHFVITSADTTSSSAITVTSAVSGGTGTDISGAGASNYMDCDSGNGTVTAKAFDPTADSGKLVKLGSDGFFKREFVKGSGMYLTAGEAIDGTTTPQAVYVSDGSNSRTAGRVYKADANDFTSAATKFTGFVKTSVSAGETVFVSINGVVDGFAGLTKGIKYFVRDTAGAIAGTPGSTNIVVGTAISATEILIERERLIIGVTESTSLSSSPTSVQFTIGFRPVAIVALQANNNANAYSAGTYILAPSIAGGASIADSNDGATALGYLSIATDNSSGTSDGGWNGSIAVTDNVSFTTTWTAYGAANTITANVKYLVFG